MVVRQVNMYKLKPYYDTSVPVQLPNCMYSMKTVSGNNPTAASSNEVDVGYLAELENRQEDILRRLELLKAEVAGLAKEKGVTAESDQGPSLTDLVVCADPSSPPVALLVLTQLLSTQHKLLTSCHCHSSARDVPPHLKTLFGKNLDALDRKGYQMAITLIWKQLQHGPTLMVNPRSQVTVEGEATVARHLARLLNPSYEDQDIVKATEIDQWVDTASQYVKGNNKEKNSILKSMNSKLGKSEWLVGSCLSLADVMMWGALVGSNVPANVNSWKERCSDQAEFAAVLKQLNIDV